MWIIGVLWWLILLPFSFISVIVAYVLGPVVVLFCNAEGWLPRWLWWFQTPDNPMDGDHGWVTEHWQWRYRLPEPLCTYVGRVGWCWRNPMYGFDTTVLAATAPREPFNWYGNKAITDSAPVVDGWLFVTSGIWWNLYIIAPCFGRTFRLYLGWKLRNGEGKAPYQYIAYVNPFKYRP